MNQDPGKGKRSPPDSRTAIPGSDMFITFEGSDGSGKTCQVAALARYLCQAGQDVLTIREPGGTPIGEQVRAVIFGPENVGMHVRTEILLFQASRAQLVEEVIRPHLQRGGVVISDRYGDSTLAYQGYGYQLDLEPLKALVNFATGGLKPDLTLLLDVNVEEGLRRRAAGGERNRLDVRELDFYRRVQDGYYQLVQADPQRWVVIDANRARDEVQAEVRRIVWERMGGKLDP